MTQHILIDGNNLLYAMHAHAPMPSIGRETMVKVIDRWARKGDAQVTLVFDGPEPPGGLAKQMASNRIKVQFSSPQTADDIIVDMIKRVKNPTSIRVITSDTAIRHEAKHRRCLHTPSVDFVHEIFAPDQTPKQPLQSQEEKPQQLSDEEKKEWLDIFDDGLDDTDEDKPFDGYESMLQ